MVKNDKLVFSIVFLSKIADLHLWFYLGKQAPDARLKMCLLDLAQLKEQHVKRSLISVRG